MAALVHLGDAAATPAATTYTITAATFGTASTDRLIEVGINYIGGVAGTSDVTVTIGGVSATKVVAVADVGQSIASYRFLAAVPTGTSGNIVFSNSAGNFTRTITSWYGLTGYSATAFDTKTADTATTNPSVSIAIAANGAVLGDSTNQGMTGPNTATWTNLTKDFDNNPAGFTSGSNASATFVSASGGTTVQVTWASGGAVGTVLAVASYQTTAVAAKSLALLGVG